MEKGDVDNGYQYGRLPCDAARGILAKVHLWLGSVAQRDGQPVLEADTTHFRKTLDLCTEIIDKINEDIFNATVAQW